LCGGQSERAKKAGKGLSSPAFQNFEVFDPLLVADVDGPGGIINAVLEFVLADFLGVFKVFYFAYELIAGPVLHPNKSFLCHVLTPFLVFISY
jgi:hypothetical protein